MASGDQISGLDKEIKNGVVDQAADDSQTSDNDGGERPVRNKLKETTITSAPQASTERSTDPSGDSSRASSRGRKRSFDDEEQENNDEEAGHRRKRSRDSATEEPPAQPEEGQSEQPQDSANALKKKRSRDQLDKDESKTETKSEIAEAKDTSDNAPVAAKAAAEGEPEKKRHRDASQERDPASLPSAFANTSSVSPFGAISTSTSKAPAEEAKPTTSSSAFASSSLSAFAGSEQSPFGSLGASTPSVFKSSTESTSAETGKPAATGFAAAAKPSGGFAALGSGFSAFSGGFGAASSGGGLTSFAAAGAPSTFASTSSKPFGAEADSDEEEEKEKEGDSGPAEFEADKTDERFFARHIETGEEEEKTYFACKAKLFHFSDKEWRERGLGNFKVNVRVIDGVEDKKSARMVMRADGVLRVMLNTALFKGMKVGDGEGNEPRSKQIILASLEGNRSVPLLLRTGSEEQAKELYHTIQDLLEHQ